MVTDGLWWFCYLRANPSLSRVCPHWLRAPGLCPHLGQSEPHTDLLKNLIWGLFKIFLFITPGRCNKCHLFVEKSLTYPIIGDLCGGTGVLLDCSHESEPLDPLVDCDHSRVVHSVLARLGWWLIRDLMNPFLHTLVNSSVGLNRINQLLARLGKPIKFFIIALDFASKVDLI